LTGIFRFQLLPAQGGREEAHVLLQAFSTGIGDGDGIHSADNREVCLSRLHSRI
jgi:hypothetical protein